MIGQIKATLEMYDLNMVEEQEFLKRIVLQKFNYQKTHRSLNLIHIT